MRADCVIGEGRVNRYWKMFWVEITSLKRLTLVNISGENTRNKIFLIVQCKGVVSLLTEVGEYLTRGERDINNNWIWWNSYADVKRQTRRRFHEFPSGSSDWYNRGRRWKPRRKILHVMVSNRAIKNHHTPIMKRHWLL